ncbi:MAG: 2-hydroxyacid dehydrogenase [Planctomycetota bacterium]
MRVAIFSAKPTIERFLQDANVLHEHELRYFETRLTPDTAALAQGCDAASAFIHDRINRPTLRALADIGVRLLALRCAGYNHVDLKAADEFGIAVCRVPGYSPHSVAEHAVGMMLALNRRIHRAHARVRDGNFSLEGLLGFDMYGKTAGLVGAGRIGACAARILLGFGMRVLVYDPNIANDLGLQDVEDVSLETLYAESDILSLHCPLVAETRHLINGAAVGRMKPGVMLINTGRGGLVDTLALIEGLKSGQIGSLGLDVYEEEEDLFYEDLSDRVIQDDTFARLLTFPNVIVTSHQGYYTDAGLCTIADTTMANLSEFELNGDCANRVAFGAPPRA